MRTTVILPDELYRQAKQRARMQERTFTSLVEHALRRELARRGDEGEEHRFVLNAFRGEGGTRPGIDVNDNAALRDLMDERAPIDKLR